MGLERFGFDKVSLKSLIVKSQLTEDRHLGYQSTCTSLIYAYAGELAGYLQYVENGRRYIFSHHTKLRI